MSSDLRKTQARKSHATHVRCLQYKKKRTYEKEKKIGRIFRHDENEKNIPKARQEREIYLRECKQGDDIGMRVGTCVKCTFSLPVAFVACVYTPSPK